MLSFHNDPLIKEKYLSRVIEHRKLDNIIKGTGWENGKGCAVGCTLENYNHSRYPIELGLPEWLARLEDAIFECLSIEESVLWPEKFLSVIPVGVDVENVRHHLAIHRMNRLINIQNENLNKFPELNEILTKTIGAIEAVKKCHESELNKLYCDWNEAWSASAEAAASALESASAEASAEAAAWASASASASAEAAASALESASAEASAEAAAWASASASASAWSASARSAWVSAEAAAWSAAAWASASASASAWAAWVSASASAWAAWVSASAWSAEASALESASAEAAWKEEAKILLKLLSECK